MYLSVYLTILLFVAGASIEKKQFEEDIDLRERQNVDSRYCKKNFQLEQRLKKRVQTVQKRLQKVQKRLQKVQKRLENVQTNLLKCRASIEKKQFEEDIDLRERQNVDSRYCKKNFQLEQRLKKRVQTVQKRLQKVQKRLQKVQKRLENVQTNLLKCRSCDNYIISKNKSSIAFSASSERSSYWGADRGYLNAVGENGTGSAWFPKTESTQQYLQVKLPTTKRISGVATQGAKHSDNWVKSFIVLYSTDCKNWQKATMQNGDTTFVGNNDENTIMKNKFKATVRARCIRFLPLCWNGSIAMRVDLIGC